MDIAWGHLDSRLMAIAFLAIATCCASAFALLRVQIAFAISRTGGADLADNSYQTKNPASLQGWDLCLVAWGRERGRIDGNSLFGYCHLLRKRLRFAPRPNCFRN